MSDPDPRTVAGTAILRRWQDEHDYLAAVDDLEHAARMARAAPDAARAEARARLGAAIKALEALLIAQDHRR